MSVFLASGIQNVSPSMPQCRQQNSMGKCGKNSLGTRLQRNKCMGGSKSQYQGVSVEGIFRCLLRLGCGLLCDTRL